MVNFEVIVLYVTVLHLSCSLTSSDQCCDGVIRLVNKSSNSSILQQVGLYQFNGLECVSENMLIYTPPQGGLSVSHCETDSWCVDLEQLQVEVCTNTTWEEAVCNKSASVHCDYLAQCQQCTLGNFSVVQNRIGSYDVTLTWLQSIEDYTTSCCQAPYYKKDCNGSNEHKYERNLTSATVTGLKPYTVYECCVSEDSKGRRTCIYVQTAQAAPGLPTNIAAYPLKRNGFLLTWKPPEAEARNGVVQYYGIMVTDRNKRVVVNKTTDTDEPHSVVDYSLTEGHEYTIQVAAYTTEWGEWEKHTWIVPSSDEMMTLLLLGFTIGLLFLILIALATVAVIVCSRMHKHNKSLIREVQEYEMTSKYSATRHDSGTLPERYLAIKKRDSNRKQPLYPPAHLASDYLTPTITKTTETTEEKNDKDEVKTSESKALEENPYQSLILPRRDATIVTPDGYIKIVRSIECSLEEETPRLEEEILPPPSPLASKPEPVYLLKSSIPQLSLESNLPPRSGNIYDSRSGTL